MAIRHSLLCLIITCFTLSGLAQRVSPDLAVETAQIFLLNNFESHEKSISDSHPDSVRLQYVGETDVPSMFAVSMDSMWVLVAGDQRIVPILAYSDARSSGFPEKEDMSPAMHDLIRWYDMQIRNKLADNIDTQLRHEDWNHYDKTAKQGIDVEYRETIRANIVSPLVARNGYENQWGQSLNNTKYYTIDTSRVYNKYCPSGPSCAHTITGCDAVAMGQIMWYWEWPPRASVKTNDNTLFLRDYIWSQMPYLLHNNTPMTDVNMVAHLLRESGIMINTDYGCSLSTASPFNIPNVMRQTFGYNVAAMVERNSYSNTAWLDILKQELDEGRPMIYSGWTTPAGAGHTFVVDGYDSYDMFHANFGWKGNGNGYFLLDDFKANSTTYLNVNQNAIIGISPNPCFPITIPSLPIWDSDFTFYHAGGITMGNRTIASGLVGTITSGNYIRLTNGVQIQAGSNVHLTIENGQPCEEAILQTRAYVPPRNNNAPHAQTAPPQQSSCSISHNMIERTIKINSLEDVLSVNIYSISGQHIFSAKRKDINISTLPSGVYIVHVQTVTGERLVEKIVHM